MHVFSSWGHVRSPECRQTCPSLPGVSKPHGVPVIFHFSFFWWGELNLARIKEAEMQYYNSQMTDPQTGKVLRRIGLSNRQLNLRSSGPTVSLQLVKYDTWYSSAND